MSRVSQVDEIKALLENDREEFLLALRSIGTNYSNLLRLLGVDELKRRFEGLSHSEKMGGGHIGTPAYIPPSPLEQRTINTEYLIDLFRVYSFAPPKHRKKRMEQFAEDHQVNPDEVFEVLNYIGLEI